MLQRPVCEQLRRAESPLRSRPSPVFASAMRLPACVLLEPSAFFPPVKPSVAGFVLPLGTTMNMSGTALYEGCVVLFVAQVFGVDLSVGQQLTLLFLSVLSAVAVAGIPGGSLPLIAGCMPKKPM